MKKIISVLLVFAFALCALCVHASGVAYNVEKAGITISIPEKMYVFTPSVSPDDERLAALGLSYEGIMSAFAEKNMYLEAMDTDNFNEIVVICEDTTDTNYYELGYDGIYNAVMAEEAAIEKSGRKIVSADLYESDHVDFAKIVSSGKDCQVEYTTVYNKKKIKIKFLDFDGSFTENEAELFEGIIDTIKFTQTPVKSKQNSETKSQKEPESPAEQKTAAKVQDSESDSDADKDDSNANKNNIDPDVLWHWLITIAVAIAICTVPALFFRFAFSDGGLRKGGAFAFALFYSLAMAALFYFAPDKISQLNVSRYICIVPLVWSFVIYKIVKR